MTNTKTKVLKIHLVLKTAEHTEPLNLAFEQLGSLHKWMDRPNEWMLEADRVRAAVARFHPDMRYDSSTRALTKLAHTAGLWTEWEKGNFDPKKLQYWLRVAIAQGCDDLADWGPVEHRKNALITTAQLAVYEGDGLRVAIRNPSLDIPDLWRRLYWFTRFYRAWQRIGAEFTPSDFAHKEKAAQKARAWKREAWAYYFKTKAEWPNLNPSAIAENYAKLTNNQAKKKDFEIYFGWRLNLVKGRKSPNKKTVGLGSSNL